MRTIGITATQAGVTTNQVRELAAHMAPMLGPVYEAHHGNCIGGDAQFVQLVWDVFQDPNILVAHPMVPDDKQSDIIHRVPHKLVLPPRHPLERNVDILLCVKMGEAGSRMYACPRTAVEEQRSGTWYTIRQAKKRHVPLTIIYPNGDTELYEGVLKRGLI